MIGDYALLILFPVGLVAGVINVVAGGGSFLTLPILIFLGLPPTVANGTNRVGIVIQNLGAVWGFQRHKVLEWRLALWTAIPATMGAALGTWGALEVGDDTFRRILAFLMIVISLWTLLKPSAKETSLHKNDSMSSVIGLTLGFFMVGIYGGFVQAGVGFLILTATSFLGLDLVKGNAVKVGCVLVFTILSLSIFASKGMVNWTLGLILGAGTFVGGQIGVRLTTLKGHRWVRKVVTVTIILFAIILWFGV